LQKSSFAHEILTNIAIFYNPIVDLTDYEKVDPSKNFSCGRFTIVFSQLNGHINYLYDTETQYTWGTDDNVLAQFTYNTYSQSDYALFMNTYLLEQPAPSWAYQDYGKPNMSNPQGIFYPNFQALFYKQNSSGYYFYSYSTMSANTVEVLGAPKSIYTNVFIPTNGSDISINFIWQNKTSTRLAEALFFSFDPACPGENASFQFNKLGEWFTTDNIILNGSKHLHALQEGVKYTNGERSITITSLDSAVVSIGVPYPFPIPLDVEADPFFGSHFMLYDNIWGTNYIQWYPYLEQDATQLFRFQLSVE
jgi:hypothetical protein